MKSLALNRLRQTFVNMCIAILFLSAVVQAKNCNNRTFNIKIAEDVSAMELLSQLSNECEFSIIANDEIADENLGKKLYGLNINKLNLNEIFNVLINVRGLNYTYNNNLLQVGGLETKTFKIDYINSERTGVSNTDISLSGDSANANEGESGGSLSTGATITSNDKFTFWSKMEAELAAILNTPLDKFKAPKPIINREAGLVTVSGTSKQIARMGTYINSMMDRLHRQVMIDVKILSVTLNDSKQTGVNWGEIYKLQNMKLNYQLLNTNNISKIEDDEIREWGDQLPSGHAQYLKLTGNTAITDLVKFLKTQGDVRAVSNPKVVTLNNQPAVFSSGDQLYYKLSASSRQTGNGSGASETYNNEVVKSVFAGILLDITPEITDDGEIILKINPSISSVKAEVSTDSSGVRRLPPDLAKKQISSVVKLRDGEKIVLGGLISSRKGNKEYKVPILGNLPLLGHVFKQTGVTEYREELVVIITPQIMHSNRGARTIVSLKELGYQSIK